MALTKTISLDVKNGKIQLTDSVKQILLVLDDLPEAGQASFQELTALVVSDGQLAAQTQTFLCTPAGTAAAIALAQLLLSNTYQIDLDAAAGKLTVQTAAGTTYIEIDLSGNTPVLKLQNSDGSYVTLDGSVGKVTLHRYVAGGAAKEIILDCSGATTAITIDGVALTNQSYPICIGGATLHFNALGTVPA